MSDELPPGVPGTACELKFVRSGGPGGQHVNKVATAVQLRVRLDRCTLPVPVRSRLIRLAGQQATSRGEILIVADRFRSQAQNRADAFDRLGRLVAEARRVQRPRVPTRPSSAARRRRTDDKKRRGTLKTLRGRPDPDS